MGPIGGLGGRVQAHHLPSQANRPPISLCGILTYMALGLLIVMYGAVNKGQLGGLAKTRVTLL